MPNSLFSCHGKALSNPLRGGYCGEIGLSGLLLAISIFSKLTLVVRNGREVFGRMIVEMVVVVVGPE